MCTFQEALEFVRQGKVHTTVIVKKFEEANQVHADMKAGKISGRVVLKIAD
jgi:propanol-preferring alcohol dehydrogenase